MDKLPSICTMENRGKKIKYGINNTYKKDYSDTNF